MTKLSRRPVFIVGCSRSGTTLLGAMLGAHMHCLCIPESQFKTQILPSVGIARMRMNVLEALEAISLNYRFKIWDMPLDTAALAEDKTVKTYAELIEWLVVLYGRKCRKENWHVWVDHTPGNIEYLDLLFDLFPAAKAIHLVRDGRGVTASILPLDWGANTITEAAHWWLEKMSFGLAAELRWGPDRIERIRYEDLVSEPARTLKRICAFVGLEYEDAILEASGFQVPKYTESQHVLIGRKVDPSRADAWKESLSQRDIEIFEAIARDFLAYLKYEPMFGVRARRATRSERRQANRRQFFRRKIFNKVRKWRRKRKI